MGHHLTEDGQFKSDKYDWCPEGFFALKLTDPLAQPVIADYLIQEGVEPELAQDLRQALFKVGYPGAHVVDQLRRMHNCAAFIQQDVQKATEGLGRAADYVSGILDELAIMRARSVPVEAVEGQGDQNGL